MPANDYHLNAIIVDDEKGCITNLQHFLSRLCPDINVIATAPTLEEALVTASKQRIDLAFLDVQLFDDNIFTALAETNNVNFKIVFVTAHSEYALQAIKTEALDYILKPLNDEDILSCYAKTKRYFFHSDPHKLGEKANSEKQQRITIKHSSNVYVINAMDLYYIKGFGFYSEIVFVYQDVIKSVIVSKPLNKLEAEYGCSFLFRAHKSYLINVNRILDINKHDGLTIKMANQQTVPVAKRRLHDFMTFLNNLP
jgi:two-component system, LytTR family, response regulator